MAKKGGGIGGRMGIDDSGADFADSAALRSGGGAANVPAAGGAADATDRRRILDAAKNSPLAPGDDRRFAGTGARVRGSQRASIDGFSRHDQAVARHHRRPTG